MVEVIAQDFIPTSVEHAPSSITLCKLTSQNCGAISKHVLDYRVSMLGVSLSLSQNDGAVDAVALSTPTHVFLVAIREAGNVQSRAGARSTTRPTGKGNLNDLAHIFSSNLCLFAGFGMARLALHLYRQLGVHVRGVDLSTLSSKSTRTPDTPAELAATMLSPYVNKGRIHALWYRNEVKYLCLRAWLSSILAEESINELDSPLEVDTQNLTKAELKCLSELVANVELLDAEKPTQIENEFDDVEIDGDGQIVIRNARFKTRVRPSKQTTVILETTHGQSLSGHAVRATGKSTGVSVAQKNFRGGIERIRVVGREELTNAERARDEFILLLLRGSIPSLARSSFIQMLWFPTSTSLQLQSRARRPDSPLISDIPGSTFSSLNASQKEVVCAMLSEDDSPIVVAHGPPGTGKTTTIGVALQKWDEYGDSVWVIAQSNVGVKNIARTLIKHDIDFKLIVSKEFYVEWHEHLYTEIERRLIRSDELLADGADTVRMLAGSHIILSTVSMLSNPALDDCGIFRIVPVECLVVDEASQIDSFEFMHLFYKFKHLRKVCMFGDPKQLPPYGKETAPLMKTIFDFKHLKPSAYFLNTQYRMPIPLGDFISEEVYNSKLKSVHKITDNSCVRFVDARKGCEESAGSSWMNKEEVHAIVNIVKNYYKHLEFCIITPYDAQRAAITQQLTGEGLPSDCVYNVDSFQGHEASYVIVSTVRTTSPGFLRSLNRMNVMLTRCKAGMTLVTNRRFLDGTGRDTLLGRLARSWRADAWVDALALSDRRASLPGAPGRAVVPPPMVHPPGLDLNSAGARGYRGGWGLSSMSAHDGWSDSSNSSYTSDTLALRPPGSAAAAAANRADAAAKGPPYHFVRPLPLSSSRHLPGASGLAERMANFSLYPRTQTVEKKPKVDPEDSDSFPALGQVQSPKVVLKGRWRHGSDACKL